MTDYYSTGGGTQFERYRSRYREQINTVLYSCISSLDARMMYSCSKADGMVVHSCRDSVECERDEEIDDYVMSMRFDDAGPRLPGKARPFAAPHSIAS